ncbi:MAG TPA: DUF4398 domain-containing protein [Azospirillaceae bacterium]|nr:DUF4398 domain-containing protein [Azospirillaceae bacterium]
MPTAPTSQLLRFAAAAGALLALSACASGPDAPPPSLPAARAAVDNVNTPDVSRYAATELQTARERLDAAEAAWRNENYDSAARLSEQALVTVRLAESRASAARAVEARADVERTIRTLENEVGISATSPTATTSPYAAPSTSVTTTTVAPAPGSTYAAPAAPGLGAGATSSTSTTTTTVETVPLATPAPPATAPATRLVPPPSR